MNAPEHVLQPVASIKRSRLPRATRMVLELLDGLEGGALAIELPGGEHLRAGHGPLVAHLRVRELAMFDEALARGDIGFGESFMDEHWDTDDLTGLLTLLSRNRERIGQAIHGRLLRMIGHRITHLLRANTRSGSRRNIEAHYDLGNDFYALWLDPSMTYSAAMFASAGEPLRDGQLRKYRRILGQLDVKPGQTILEIGCGWGGFAEVAATEFGCRVLGITLPDPDLKWNEERQHYDYGQIDWDEFWATVNGNGPCNKERLGTRVKAHNDGQWVREAAMAYARKQQERAIKEAA